MWCRGSSFQVAPRVGLEQRLDKYASLPEPRIFKSHLPYDHTPGRDVARFIIVMRDPRDRVISAYHHMVDMTDDMLEWAGGKTRPESFEAFFDRWLPLPHIEHTRDWWSRRDEPNIFVIRFEDLKRDLPRFNGSADRVSGLECLT